MGEPINSSRDDFSYIVDTTGQKGYFASNRLGGKGDDDIYSFLYTINLNTISGVVEDASTGDLLEGAKVTLLTNNGELLAETTTDGEGRYTFKNLESTTEYTLQTEKEGYLEDIANANTKENQGVEITQYLKRIKTNDEIAEPSKNFEPNNVYFDFDSYQIKKESAQELDKLVAILKENETLELKIASHTDSRGSNAYNKYLSDKRAKATRDYIVSRGIDPARILSAIGYGEERLLNNCSDGNKCPPDKHRLNRRSEFIIVEQ